MSSSWWGLSQGHWPAPVCMAASFLCLVLSCHAMFFLHYHPGDPFHLFPLCWISCFLYQMSSSFFGFLPYFGRTKSLFMRDSQQVSLLRSCLAQKCLYPSLALGDWLMAWMSREPLVGKNLPSVFWTCCSTTFTPSM